MDSASAATKATESIDANKAIEYIEKNSTTIMAVFIAILCVYVIYLHIRINNLDYRFTETFARHGVRPSEQRYY